MSLKGLNRPGFVKQLLLVGLIVPSCFLVISATTNSKEIETKIIEPERARVIALDAIGQYENTPETLAEISFPESVRELFPNIRLISLPHDSDPPSWSRVVVDNDANAFVLQRFDSYPPQWEENLSDLLWSQGLLGVNSNQIARVTVAITFLTHSQPGLIFWTALEEVETPDDLARLIEDVVVENLTDNTYRSSINLVSSEGAKKRITYRFNPSGKLIDIQETYGGQHVE